MSASQRAKGQRGEAEVRAIYEAHGFAVRGLEGSGDHLAIRDGLVIHSEVKRHETLRLPAWTRQARRECPDGAIPVVAFRRNREPWQAVALEVGVFGRLYENGYRAGIHYSLRHLNGSAWVLSDLVVLLDGLR